jgi:hypothetical protein
MIVPSKNQKTYGVLHTENYFSFLGFCKKVNSDEIQKVDVYLDDVLINTIIADKHLQKIEDIYELDGFGFTYILPNEYIGKKSVISFKNHETQENLQNSPYKLIKENHPKFGEMAFFNNLEIPIDEEKIKNIYCKNTIGFLATEENLENKEFIEYIKELQKKFSNIKLNIFYLNNAQKKLAESIFKDLTKIKLIYPKDIYEINENCLIWLTVNDKLSLKIKKHIRFSLFINFRDKSLSIKEYENKYKNSFRIFYSNPTKFGGNDNSSYFGIAYNNLIKSLDSNLFIDINTNYFEFSSFTQVDLALKYDNFIDKLKKLSSLLQD